MSEPIFKPAMEDMWSRLPAVYRDEDEKVDWQFKRWLSGMGNIVGSIEELLERFEYRGPGETDDRSEKTSALGDSKVADPEWFDWIGMIRGITLPPALKEGQKRTALQANSYLAGSRNSLRDAVRSTLTGTRFCQIFDHSETFAARGASDEWHVLVVTRASEKANGYTDDYTVPNTIYLRDEVEATDDPDVLVVTDFPDPDDPDIWVVDNFLEPVETIIRQGLKPVGVILHHHNLDAASWNSVEAEFPNWNAWDAAGSWQAIEQADGVPNE